MRRIRGFSYVLVVLAAGVAFGVLAGAAAQAGTVVVLPRPGQVGVGLDYLYGSLLSNGNLGDAFGSGPGLAVRVRYRMRYERGFGLTFESHALAPRPGDQVDLLTKIPMGENSADAYKQLNLYLYGVDFYQMLGTRTKTTKMLSVGAGLAHPTFALKGGEQQFVFGDGVYLGAGAGVERFFWRSVAFDLGARYQAVFIDGTVNHEVQFSAGLIFYASL